MKKYSVTFPHAGEYFIAFEYFFRMLGYDVVVPPKTDKLSFDLGIKYSPPQACLPFKVTLGNLIQGMERGANVVNMIGGKTGICRLAYYTPLYRKILMDCGYSFELINFKLKKELWTTIKTHMPNATFGDFLKSFYGFWLKMRLIELAREQSLSTRPYEEKSGASTEAFKRSVEMIQRTDDIHSLKMLPKDIVTVFETIPKDKSRKTIKIGLVGEFFLVIDQYSTLNLESLLGKLGAVVSPSLSFSEFFVGSIKQVRFIDRFFPTRRHTIAKLARPYIDRPIGGHAMQSIGETVHFAQQGFDGVVHLYPFTCMPEIMASSIFTQVSADCGIPVMSMCFDEQTGLTGLQTRLEAFVDMIARRKEPLPHGIFKERRGRRAPEQQETVGANR